MLRGVRNDAPSFVAGGLAKERPFSFPLPSVLRRVWIFLLRIAVVVEQPVAFAGLPVAPEPVLRAGLFELQPVWLFLQRLAVVAERPVVFAGLPAARVPVLPAELFELQP